MKKAISFALAVAATLGFAALPSSAATPSISGVKPAPTAENQSVPLNFTLSGVSWADVLVTITVDNGGVTVDETGSITAQPGYSLSDTTAATQSFHGSLADVKAALSSGLTWYTPSTVDTYNFGVTMKVQEFVEGLTYNPGNGHYYLVPAETMTARDAFDAAAAGDYVYAGIVGYVAEINDAQENDFVSQYSGGSNIWIGGSADYVVLNAHDGTSFADNNASLGKWYWVHSNVQFAEGLSPDIAAIDDAYMNWADGEPNNSDDPDEACIVTNWNDVPGEWNDLNCGDNWSNNFIIEFDPALGSGISVLTLETQDLTPALAETGSTNAPVAGFAALAIIAGVVAVRYSRKFSR